MKFDYIDTRTAAKRLGVQESTLRRWRHLGKGPAYMKIGARTVRYDPDSVDKFAALGKVDPAGSGFAGVN